MRKCAKLLYKKCGNLLKWKNKKCGKKKTTMFKRKIYSKMQEWKKNSNGKTALLIEGARRIGKSTVVEEFAKNEYQSYLLIDFSSASKETNGL